MAEMEATEGRPQGTKRGDIEAQPEMVFPRVLSQLTARSLQTLAGRGAIGRKIREINDFQRIAVIDRKELTRAGNALAKSWRCPFRGGHIDVRSRSSAFLSSLSRLSMRG